MEIKTILVDDEILAMRLFELECARFEDIKIGRASCRERV